MKRAIQSAVVVIAGMLLTVAYFLVSGPVVGPVLDSLLEGATAPPGVAGVITELLLTAVGVVLGAAIGAVYLVAGIGTAYLIATKLLGWRNIGQ